MVFLEFAIRKNEVLALTAPENIVIWNSIAVRR
jgi:hypothetical protein